MLAPHALAQESPVPAEAGAASTGVVPIRGQGLCPDPAAVWSEIDTLIVRERLEPRLRALADADHPVEILDLGGSFRVLAAGRTRDYPDAARDCGHRAKLASLFVALAFDASGEPPAAPPPAAVVAAAPATTGPPAAARLASRLELGAALDAGVGPAWLAPGAAARLVVGRAGLGGVAGARAYLPADATLGGVRLRSWRIAADLLARMTFGSDRPLRPFVELGAAGTFLSARATDLAAARDAGAFELGLVAGAGVAFARRGALWPFASVRAEWIPRPVVVFARPVGSVGDTPPLWIGANLGFSVGIF